MAATDKQPRTLFEKVWDAHVVRPETPDTPAVLYVDLHLMHEVTSPQAFSLLRERGLRVRRLDQKGHRGAQDGGEGPGNLTAQAAHTA